MQPIFQKSTDCLSIKKMAINSKTYLIYKNTEFTLTRPISYVEIFDVYLLTKSFLKDLTMNPHIYFRDYLSAEGISEERFNFVERINEAIK